MLIIVTDIMNKTLPVSVVLTFPQATNKKYSISLSAAYNSEFLRHIIDNDNDYEDNYKNVGTTEWLSNRMDVDIDEDRKIMYFEIPFNFYKTLREVDIDWFIELWLGTSYWHDQRVNRNIFNLPQIAHLSRILLLNQDFQFIKILDSNYPPIVDNNNSWTSNNL